MRQSLNPSNKQEVLSKLLQFLYELLGPVLVSKGSVDGTWHVSFIYGSQWTQQKGRKCENGNSSQFRRSLNAVEIYNFYKWDKEEDSKVLEEILKTFELLQSTNKNVTWERHVFNTRDQQPTESIDQCVTDPKLESKSCEFGPLRDDLIRDRIVCGIRDDNVKPRLLKEVNLTLQSALYICRASEVAFTQMKTLSSEKAVWVAAAKSTRSRPTSKPGKDTSHKSLCGRCGNKHHRSEEDCPAWENFG
ncbi:hypothetical protein HOLleu_43750 [Holothuria leucospilota]|uniref:Uncharacterized protein n=1 Tax=Holothuria leucospilota TaxID=206669 RepID=A0A9Q0YBA0_HOLLE|nr:hypothetical protein HOLleu_43750 [Holothuria leucospilota]